MNEIDVSVIIPVFNAAAFLRECLDSVLGQSLRNIEVVCVDDGSSDGSSEILREYASRDPRLRIITQENVGPGRARNAALKHVTGRYLAFCDADDVMGSGELAKAFRVAETECSDVVVFGHSLFESATRRTLDVRAFSGDLVGGAGGGFATWTPEALGGRIFSTIGHALWDKLFRRSLVEANGICCQEQRRVEDLYFADKALLCARRITLLPDVFYRYRRGTDSVTTHGEWAGFCFDGYREIRELLERRGDFALFAPAFLEHVFYSFVEELMSVTETSTLEAVYPRFRQGLQAVVTRADFCGRLPSPYWRSVYDLALSERTPVEIRSVLSRMERNRVAGKPEEGKRTAGGFHRAVKYLLLIPWRLIGLPRLYRRCVRNEERLAAAEERLVALEHDLTTTVRALEANLRAIRRGDPMP